MSTWQERLGAEKQELGERLNKLDAFLTSDAFYGLDEIDRWLLVDQFDAMTRYQLILTRRLQRTHP